MQLDSHIDAIQQDLAATASIGDEATAEAARRLSDALGSTLHLRLLDLLGEAALELSGQLGGTARIEVRLAGRDPELVVVSEESQDATPLAVGEELSGRISLRLPESLKAAVEAAAAQEGISTNAWLVRTIAHSLHTRTTRKPGRNRLQGYAQG
jgi:HicB family